MIDDKVAWLTDGGILAERLQKWLATATPASHWYLETLAIPV